MADRERQVGAMVGAQLVEAERSTRLHASARAAAELARRRSAAAERPARLATGPAPAPVPAGPPPAPAMPRQGPGPDGGGAVLARAVPLRGGGLADEVVLPDPDTGARVVVLRARAATAAERLAAAGLLSADAAAAAEWLRGAWNRAALEGSGSLTQSWERGSGGAAAIVRDAAAWRAYCDALASLPAAARPVVVAVAIHDEPPGSLPRLALLADALARLHTGLRRKAA